MTTEEKLVMLKANLEIIPANTLWDAYLTNLLTASEQMIGREGITLGDTLEDNNLVVMYASYLYRKRATDNAPMPRMLRYALNNRLFAEKVGDGNA